MAAPAKVHRLPRTAATFLLGPSGDLSGHTDEPRRGSTKNYALVVPPGRVVLRQLSIAAISRRERRPALQLAAESVLTGSLDDYLIDYWHIEQNNWGMAAIPRGLLEDYPEFVDKTGRAATRIQVPELSQELKNGLVLWTLEDAVTVCAWQNGVLTEWQTMPRPNGTTALGRFLHHALPIDVTEILIRAPGDPGSTYGKQIATTCSSIYPSVKIRVLEKPLTESRGRLATLCAFPQFIQEQAFQPASPSRKRGALLSGILLLASVAVFLVVQLQDMENQAAEAEHATSLLKIQAARSSRIADRVSRLMAEVRETRSLNQNSMVALLDDLSAVMPSTIRLAGALQIDRRGILSLDGVSDEEQDIGSFVRQLGRHPRVKKVRLQSVTAAQQDQEKDQGIRFRVRVQLERPLWNAPAESVES